MKFPPVIRERNELPEAQYIHFSTKSSKVRQDKTMIRIKQNMIYSGWFGKVPCVTQTHARQCFVYEIYITVEPLNIVEHTKRNTYSTWGKDMIQNHNREKQ